MADIFLYGTLRHAALLDVVAGGETQLVAAQLSGFATYWAKGEAFPLITREDGGVAQGMLLRGASDEMRARLDFYERPFGYALHPVEVTVDGTAVPALVYLPDADAPWQAGAHFDLAQWQAQSGQWAVLAAQEIMRLFGQVTDAELRHRFAVIGARAQSRLRAEALVTPPRIGSGLSARDVEVTDTDFVHDGFFTLQETQLRYRRFDGSNSQAHSRMVLRAGDAVTVLPYDPIRDRVLLIEQFRHAVFAHGDPHPWLLEPVAGINDAGESYEQTARREAMEEAGVTLSDLHYVGRYYPTPGVMAQVLISYVGLADLPDDLAGLGGLAEEGEDIQGHILPFATFAEMLEADELRVAPLVLSAHWLVAHRDRLRGQS